MLGIPQVKVYSMSLGEESPVGGGPVMYGSTPTDSHYGVLGSPHW